MKTQYNSIARKLVLPLMFGMAVMAASAVEAAVPDAANIINGNVDVNGGGVSNADDRNNVWLWCDDAAPSRVRIINGLVDVTEDNLIQNDDDVRNCDLTVEDAAGVPSRREVDILNGRVDVNGDTAINGADDLNNVQLFIDASN
ncbi:hypothetical protein [Methyloglobulus sp.]|uniref:hypothetical protein n=1 Tax=Methyloglobulus sp. TaxID=2518622 RepID=UPI0032B73F7C